MARACWILVAIAGCGRLGFDSAAGGADAKLHDVAPFDAPNTCLTPLVPTTCTTATPGVELVAVGLEHVCVARAGARMDCWGYNKTGQLGFCLSTLSIDRAAASYGFDLAQVSAGEDHTCVRLADGTAWCWGAADEGQTGHGAGSTPDPVPVQIAGTWIDISAHRFHTCAIDTSAALWCWGRNLEGQLGVGDMIDHDTPQRVGTANDWQLVRAGGLATCGLHAGGVAWCWGDNSQNQIGDGGAELTQPTPAQVSTTARFQQLALGKLHACGLDLAGKVWCWGRGSEGEMGNGQIGPAANERTPFQVGGTYKQVSAGWFHVCAIDTAGALWCWGDNTNMYVFPTVQTSIATPMMVDAGPWAEVQAGQYMTCARRGSGAVSCWGFNNNGQLGVGDTMDRSTPTPACFGP